jgi:hypothetical protein
MISAADTNPVLIKVHETTVSQEGMAMPLSFTTAIGARETNLTGRRVIT